MEDFGTPILLAVQMIASNLVSKINYDRTARGTIVSVEDASTGTYRVRIQNGIFTAHASLDKKYKVNDQVYVSLPSNGDYNTIKGRVDGKITEYLAPIELKDRYNELTRNLLIIENNKVDLCSYKTEEKKITSFSLQKSDIADNKNEAKALYLGFTVQTSIPTEQQFGNGIYGVKVVTELYDAATSSIVHERTYTLDINNMTGSPYKYTLPSTQYIIFPFDGLHFITIKSITPFVKGFPKQDETKPDDIFISDIDLHLLEPLTAEELDSESLKIFPSNGGRISSYNYDVILTANLKIKGKNLNLINNSDVSFYWFVKDTTVRGTDNLNYCRYGGEGWRCLNLGLTKVEDGKTIRVSWTPGIYRYQINANNVIASSEIYKCVAVYEDVILVATRTIYKDLGINVHIDSSAGENFYFDSGKTTLTCSPAVIDGYTDLEYYWDYERSDGAIIEVDGHSNTLEDIKINLSTDYIIYNCTIYGKRSDIIGGDPVRIGTGSIRLTNAAAADIVLTILNGNQIFKYDGYGLSPASPVKEEWDRITPQPLSFTLLSPDGTNIISLDSAEQATIDALNPRWILPDDYENTSLIIPVSTVEYGTLVDPSTNTSKTYPYVPGKSFEFTILNNYDIRKSSNQIILQVEYNGKTYKQSTNFTFVKEGLLGTNGTNIVTRIVPTDDRVEKIFAYGDSLYTKNINGGISKLISTSKIFKFQAYASQENPVVYGPNGGSSTPANQNITWKALTLGGNTKTNLEVANDGSSITPKAQKTEGYPMILQARLKDNGKLLSPLASDYYATYSIDYIEYEGGSIGDNPYFIIDGGYRDCMYDTNGSLGKYRQTPFKLRAFKDGELESVSEYLNIWYNSWDNKSSLPLGGDEEVTIEPPKLFDNTKLLNYIRVQVKKNNELIATIYLTIYLYLNRYDMPLINGWDGTSIDIDETSGSILAPQVGAGKKNSNNTFTGVTIGKTYQVTLTGNKEEIGLFGYHEGARTIFLDANEGNATFGISGYGQIKIEPTKGTITGGNYDDSQEGTPDQEKTGMLIDLAEPKIKYKSGNFVVDKMGYITARGGGSIAGWKISNNSLYSVNEKIYLNSKDNDSDSDSGSIELKDASGKIFSGSHNALTSANDGFYLSHDGLSIGSKAWISSTGVLRLGKNAVNNNKLCWTIDASDDVKYMPIDPCSLVNPASAGTLYDLISTNNYLLTKDTMYVRDKFYYKYDALTQQYYYNSQVLDEIASLTNPSTQGLYEEDGSTYKRTTDTKVNFNKTYYVYNSSRTYLSYNTTNKLFDIADNKITIDQNKAKVGDVYIGTDGLRFGKKFAVDINGNVVSHYLLANYGGLIGGWTINRDILQGGETTLNSNGTITCSILYANNKGKIGGWTIDGNKLYSKTITMQTGDNGYISGGTDSGDNWKINNNGTASFNNVTITGGSLTISGSGTGSGEAIINSNGSASFTNVTITGGSLTISGSGTAKINSDGSASFTNVNITGGPTSGSVLNIGNGKAKINSDGTASFTNVTITGNNASTLTWGQSSDNKYFNVSTDGTLTAKAVNVSGTITATAGTIGGCQINGGKLEITDANITGTITVNKISTSGAGTGRTAAWSKETIIDVRDGTSRASAIRIPALSVLKNSDGVVTGVSYHASNSYKSYTVSDTDMYLLIAGTNSQ